MAPRFPWGCTYTGEHNQPFGKFCINDLETIFGLFHGGSLHLHLKTAEELVVMAGGREHWPGAINGKLFCLMLPGLKNVKSADFWLRLWSELLALLSVPGCSAPSY